MLKAPFWLRLAAKQHKPIGQATHAFQRRSCENLLYNVEPAILGRSLFPVTLSASVPTLVSSISSTLQKGQTVHLYSLVVWKLQISADRDHPASKKKVDCEARFPGMPKRKGSPLVSSGWGLYVLEWALVWKALLHLSQAKKNVRIFKCLSRTCCPNFQWEHTQIYGTQPTHLTHCFEEDESGKRLNF